MDHEKPEVRRPTSKWRGLNLSKDNKKKDGGGGKKGDKEDSEGIKHITKWTTIRYVEYPKKGEKIIRKKQQRQQDYNTKVY